MSLLEVTASCDSQAEGCIAGKNQQRHVYHRRLQLEAAAGIGQPIHCNED
jgi:hypothetical protein